MSQSRQGVPLFQSNDYLQEGNPTFAQHAHHPDPHLGHHHYGHGQSQPMDLNYLQPSNPEALHARN
jgi:hypothetical protein